MRFVRAFECQRQVEREQRRRLADPQAGRIAVQQRDAVAQACELGLGQRGPATERLRWITVLNGREVRLITVEDICYFRADSKYVAVVTADGEALITTPLQELVERLDPAVFWRIHRSTVVNVTAVHSVRRTIAGRLELRLKQRAETLRVSSAQAHRFKHM